MKTIKINSKNLREVLRVAGQTIKKGGVIVCPTDTVYGLLADASNEQAVKKVFKIKKRAFDKPLPLFIKDLKTAQTLAKISKEQEKKLKKFWPGQVTAILEAKPSRVIGTTRQGKIGLRIPNYDLISQLFKTVKKPLTGTSANISNWPATGKIKEIIEQFKEKKAKPDLIINAGDLPENEPSTVIDLTKKRPKILRQGRIKM